MNPMAMIMQMMKGGANPQQFLKNMLGNNQAMQNPMAKNALEMAQSGNFQGVEKIARNLCKEKGINADETFNSIKNQFGI